jgi:hypothetical protein
LLQQRKFIKKIKSKHGTGKKVESREKDRIQAIRLGGYLP